VITISSKILDYISSSSKNKIIFHEDIQNDFTVDIGIALSNKIYGQNIDTRFSHTAISILEELLTESIINDENYGKCLFIKNIGILLEPELKLNFVKTLDKYSNNNTLFVKWDGEIDNGKLYFLTKQNGIEININELSHISI
jgi:hypothetical protein